MEKKEKKDIVVMIMDFEEGNLDEEGVLTLFSELIKTGVGWELQGHYGRICENLISKGIISDKGKIIVHKL